MDIDKITQIDLFKHPVSLKAIIQRLIFVLIGIACIGIITAACFYGLLLLGWRLGKEKLSAFSIPIRWCLVVVAWMLTPLSVGVMIFLFGL